MIRNLMGAAAAVALTASPVMAAPNPAASLSVAKSVRTGSVSGKRSDLAGGGGFYVAAIAAIAVIIGVIIIADNSDSK